MTRLILYTLINILSSSSACISKVEDPLKTLCRLTSAEGPNRIVCLLFICLHDKMLITQVYQKQKRVSLSYHTGHATIANALVKTCFLIGDNVCDFQTMIVFCEYIASLSIAKIVCTIETDILDCRKAFF